jgi:PAS domain-containing protein
MATPTRGKGTATDAADARRAEAVLGEREERLALVFESLPIGVCLIDREGTVLLANERALEYLPTRRIPYGDPARRARWRGPC